MGCDSDRAGRAPDPRDLALARPARPPFDARGLNEDQGRVYVSDEVGHDPPWWRSADPGERSTRVARWRRRDRWPHECNDRVGILLQWEWPS